MKTIKSIYDNLKLVMSIGFALVGIIVFIPYRIFKPYSNIDADIADNLHWSKYDN